MSCQPRHISSAAVAAEQEGSRDAIRSLAERAVGIAPSKLPPVHMAMVEEHKVELVHVCIIWSNLSHTSTSEYRPGCATVAVQNIYGT